MKYAALALYVFLVLIVSKVAALVAREVIGPLAGHIAASIIGAAGGWMLTSIWVWIKAVRL